MYREVMKIVKRPNTTVEVKIVEIKKACEKYDVRRKMDPQNSKADELLLSAVEKVQGNDATNVINRNC